MTGTGRRLATAADAVGWTKCSVVPGQRPRLTVVTGLFHRPARQATAAREECGLFCEGEANVLFTTENEYQTLCEKYICTETCEGRTRNESINCSSAEILSIPLTSPAPSPPSRLRGTARLITFLCLPLGPSLVTPLTDSVAPALIPSRRGSTWTFTCPAHLPPASCCLLAPLCACRQGSFTRAPGPSPLLFPCGNCPQAGLPDLGPPCLGHGVCISFL